MRHNGAFLAVSLLIIALLALPTYAAYIPRPGDPGFVGCAFVKNGHTYDDIDCDKVADESDNCPFSANVDQRDQDNNDVGDACDLIIADIRVEPERPLQGRSVLIRVTLINNKQEPISGLHVQTEFPTLNAGSDDIIARIEPGAVESRELMIRLPECAPAKLTELATFVELFTGPSERQLVSKAFKVPIGLSGDCPTGGASPELTTVDIIESQDIHGADGALYPFTITNNQEESRAYVLTIAGTAPWGIGRIETGTVIVVAPGESRDGALRLWATPETMPGAYEFTFTVQARDDAKQVSLRAVVPPPEQPIGDNIRMQIVLGVLTFCVILVLVGVWLFLRGEKTRKQQAPHRSRR